MLKAKYPQDTCDFSKALNRLQPRFRGDSYVHYFNIPVRWTAIYANPAMLPDISSEAAALCWVEEQTALSAQLQEMSISPDDFRWEFSKGQLYPT
ncbi:MAG: hypothetical protein IPL65_01775 [Lewinellaceae bacterium]|nr:hypothetical protein [Lewinellaceae bacterium]